MKSLGSSISASLLDLPRVLIHSISKTVSANIRSKAPCVYTGDVRVFYKVQGRIVTCSDITVVFVCTGLRIIYQMRFMLNNELVENNKHIRVVPMLFLARKKWKRNGEKSDGLPSKKQASAL